MSAEVPDGATQRHARLMELLTFLETYEPHGVSMTLIQAHMLTTYGLKFKTTAEMLRECSTSGLIKVDGLGLWHLTEKQHEALEEVRKQDAKRLERHLRARIEAELRPAIEKEVEERLRAIQGFKEKEAKSDSSS